MIKIDKQIITGFRSGVCDDFSSGDLSKWTFTPGSPQRTDPQVISGAMNWASSTTAGYGNETLVSTNTFDLTATATDVLKLQMNLVDIIQKTGDPNNSYDAFALGWTDAAGNVLEATLNWRMADDTKTLNESVLRFSYNGAVIGGTGSQLDMMIAAGDVLTFSYNGSMLLLDRDRAGTVTILRRVAWSRDAGFGSTGNIYLAANLEGAGGEVTPDNIAVQTIPEPVTLGLFDFSLRAYVSSSLNGELRPGSGSEK